MLLSTSNDRSNRRLASIIFFCSSIFGIFICILYRFDTPTDIIRDNKTVFKTKVLEKARKTNSNLLEIEDGQIKRDERIRVIGGNV